MIQLLTLSLVLVHCALAGKHRRGKRHVHKWPSEKLTIDPTSFPSASPTHFECPSKYLNDMEGPNEFVMVVDNSCGLSKAECDVQQKQIGDIFRQIKVDRDPFYTQVAYIEYCSDGAETRIGLKDWAFQRDADKYYDFIMNGASCGGGGVGKSDVVTGLNYAVNEYLLNGDNECDPKRKIIVINNCEQTGYQYNGDNKELEDIMDQLKDINYFKSVPDMMIFNIPPQLNPAKNAISNPYEYLAFLAAECDEALMMPSAGQLCVAPSCSLNDGEITSSDYTDAAVVIDGLIADRNDKCFDEQRLCDFVNVPNTPKPTNKPSHRPTKRPTYRPTMRPTQRPTNRPTKKYPTEWPTVEPTENEEVCLKIVYRVSTKMESDCLSSEWQVRLNGERYPLATGGFAGNHCIRINPKNDYTLKVMNGCGKIMWFVDGAECGSHSYPNRQSATSDYVAMDFPIKCGTNSAW